MFGCLDFRPDFTNNPIFIDEECLAVDAHVRLAVVVLLFPHAIQLRNSRIGIGKQWILQPILVGKFLMGSNVVSAHTEHNNPTDRKSTRLNSSHVEISYAVFCLKKKKIY